MVIKKKHPTKSSRQPLTTLNDNFFSLPEDPYSLFLKVSKEEITPYLERAKNLGIKLPLGSFLGIFGSLGWLDGINGVEDFTVSELEEKEKQAALQEGLGPNDVIAKDIPRTILRKHLDIEKNLRAPLKRGIDKEKIATLLFSLDRQLKWINLRTREVNDLKAKITQFKYRCNFLKNRLLKLLNKKEYSFLSDNCKARIEEEINVTLFLLEAISAPIKRVQDWRDSIGLGKTKGSVSKAKDSLFNKTLAAIVDELQRVYSKDKSYEITDELLAKAIPEDYPQPRRLDPELIRQTIHLLQKAGQIDTFRLFTALLWALSLLKSLFYKKNRNYSGR